MKTENPYASSPTPADRVSTRELQRLARQMTAYRQSPPTIASIFLGWRALPLLIAFGVVFVGLLMWIGGESESLVARYSPIVMASVLIGASVRDIGNIRRFVRAWPAWNKIIDWKKVEEFAN